MNPWKLLEQGQQSKRPAQLARGVKTARRLDEQQVDHLVARYAELQSLRLLAAEFELDRATVRQHLKRRGVRPRQVHRMSEVDIAHAVSLYAAGRSSIAIGRELGFDNHTVLNSLRSANVVIRPALGR